MTDLENEIYELISHIESYVGGADLVILNERQRELIVAALDGYYSRREEQEIAGNS